MLKIPYLKNFLRKTSCTKHKYGAWFYYKMSAHINMSFSNVSSEFYFKVTNDCYSNVITIH